MRISKANQQDWLEKILPLHARLAGSVKSLLENILKQKEIEFLSVESRVKNITSALEKVERKRYEDPTKQMTDLSGIRVITYLEQQVTEVSETIKELFEVDGQNSLDRTRFLGGDRVGYRSAHFVCSLGREREQLPENKSLSDLKFEIQVRTVLQHAWAELAHDRAFKFKASLPPKIERKLNLYAGMLEVVDGAFGEIAAEIDAYKISLDEKTLEQLSSVGIDTLSVDKFVRESATSNGIKLGRGDTTHNSIEAIKDFGLENIGQLESLATPEFIRSYKRHINNPLNAVGYTRLLLLNSDVKKAMANRKWTSMPRDVADFLAAKYGADEIKNIVDEQKITIENGASRSEDRQPQAKGAKTKLVDT